MTTKDLLVSEIGHISDARERLISRARRSFGDLRKYRDIEDAASVRKFLIYAEAGFGELDPEGEKSAEDLENELTALEKVAYRRLAIIALEDAIKHKCPAKIHEMFFNLRRARSSVEEIAKELQKSQEEIFIEVAIALSNKTAVQRDD